METTERTGTIERTDAAHTLGLLAFRADSMASVTAHSTCSCGREFSKTGTDSYDARRQLLVQHVAHRADEDRRARESERAELEKALHAIFTGLYATHKELGELMDRPLIHGELTPGSDVYPLSEEWHLLHAAMMSSHATQTLIHEAEKRLQERPA